MKDKKTDWTKLTEDFFKKETLERTHVPQEELTREGWFSAAQYASRLGISAQAAFQRLIADSRLERGNFWVVGGRHKTSYFRVKQ